MKRIGWEKLNKMKIFLALLIHNITVRIKQSQIMFQLNFQRKKTLLKIDTLKIVVLNILWTRPIDMLSAGELNWLGMIIACECDPRVLLIDDYGMYFNSSMEKDFRNQLLKMNRSLGTTIILTSPSDMYLKYFASVLIFLDHGHISKIRTGNSRSSKRENNYKKSSFNKNKRNYKKRRYN